MPLKPSVWMILQDEIHAWSMRNFPGNTPLTPLTGLIKKVGELAHARIKGQQGIRGDPAAHLAAERDALGDAMIYLLDICGWQGWVPTWNPAEVRQHRRVVDDEDAFLNVAWHAGCLANSPTQANVIMMAIALARYAIERGWDIAEITRETWAEVRRRDWIAYPETGRPPVPGGPDPLRIAAHECLLALREYRARVIASRGQSEIDLGLIDRLGEALHESEGD